MFAFGPTAGLPLALVMPALDLLPIALGAIGMLVIVGLSLLVGRIAADDRSAPVPAPAAPRATTVVARPRPLSSEAA
jgi:hypothetical protein